MMMQLFGEKIASELDTIVGIVGALLQRANEKNGEKDGGESERDESGYKLALTSTICCVVAEVATARIDLGT